MSAGKAPVGKSDVRGGLGADQEWRWSAQSCPPSQLQPGSEWKWSLCCFSAVGHSLWSVTQPQPSQLRPSLTILFVHLAAFDLLVTFVVVLLSAIWEIIVQWLARDITCGTLMFLKLMAIYAAAFLPVATGLHCQAAVLHLIESRSPVRKLLRAAWGLFSAYLVPGEWLVWTQG